MSRTVEAARNKWKGICLQLGIERDHLTGKHTSCPICGGTDRFRFDDKEGRGTWICSVCGAGSGMDLLTKALGMSFRDAADRVDQIVGNVRPEPAKQGITEDRSRKLLRELWLASRDVTDGDPVTRYLAGRGVPMPQNRKSLRYVDRTRAPDGSMHPAMLAIVSDVTGKPVTMHRTFLGPNGKADMADARATMPGTIPDGCAIRLSMHGERLGIAEGIETALAASARFGLPVWAAINATMMTKWEPPAGVREVVVFGDNDATFTGHAAAYALARRLVMRNHVAVRVEIPAQPGTDWADAHAA